VLQCVAVCCSVLQCAAMNCSAVCCNKLQCVAVCCSMLQCVAVCCRVLQGLRFVVTFTSSHTKTQAHTLSLSLTHTHTHTQTHTYTRTNIHSTKFVGKRALKRREDQLQRTRNFILKSVQLSHCVVHSALRACVCHVKKSSE